MAGEDSTAAVQSDVESNGEQVTISYAVWDSNQAKLIQTMADEFEKANPNIKIDIQVSCKG